MDIFLGKTRSSLILLFQVKNIISQSLFN